MTRHRAASEGLLQPLLEWRASLDGFLRFQQSYVARVAEYTARVGDLTASRSVDPGEWIEDYATFLSGIVHDLGDWMLERQNGSLQAGLPFYRSETKKQTKKKNGTMAVPLQVSGVIPLGRAKLRAKEGTAGVPLHIPAAVFVGLPGRDPKVTLLTDGLLVEGGGTPLAGTHIHFVPNPVRRSKPEAELKISDVAGAVSKGAIYRGVVWAKPSRRVADGERKQVVAVVEIHVL